jgi:hypothetical protein
VRATPRDPDAIMLDCFVCGRKFQCGPHIYNGRNAPGWDEVVCDSCRASNWDGLVPSTWPHVIPALKAKGVEVKLNANGWLDIPG